MLGRYVVDCSCVCCHMNCGMAWLVLRDRESGRTDSFARQPSHLSRKTLHSRVVERSCHRFAIAHLARDIGSHIVFEYLILLTAASPPPYAKLGFEVGRQRATTGLKITSGKILLSCMVAWSVCWNNTSTRCRTTNHPEVEAAARTSTKATRPSGRSGRFSCAVS